MSLFYIIQILLQTFKWESPVNEAIWTFVKDLGQDNVIPY